MKELPSSFTDNSNFYDKMIDTIVLTVAINSNKCIKILQQCKFTCMKNLWIFIITLDYVLALRNVFIEIKPMSNTACLFSDPHALSLQCLHPSKLIIDKHNEFSYNFANVFFVGIGYCSGSVNTRQTGRRANKNHCYFSLYLLHYPFVAFGHNCGLVICIGGDNVSLGLLSSIIGS